MSFTIAIDGGRSTKTAEDDVVVFNPHQPIPVAAAR